MSNGKVPLNGTTITDASNVIRGATGNVSTYPIVITSVTPTASSPTNSIDIVGNNDGTIGQYCKATGTGALPNGCNAACNCYFQYSVNNALVPRTVAPTTCELNLVRCPLNSLDSDISQLSVQLRNDTTFSKTVSFVRAGASNPTIRSAYAKVQRYLCKKIVSVPNPFESGDPSAVPGNLVRERGILYDPTQSDDSTLGFPYNFYTTNPGKTIRDLTTLSGGRDLLNSSQEWDCTLPYGEKPSWANFAIHSASTTLDANDPRISDEKGTDNARNSFYVARTAGGQFTVPIYATVLPPLYKSGSLLPNGESIPPLGYGVSAASGSCPANPPPCTGQSTDSANCGMQWGKLFAFRTSMPKGSYLSRGSILKNISRIACNPGRYTTSGAMSDKAFSLDCAVNSPGIGPNVVAGSQAGGTLLASRLIQQTGQDANGKPFVPACVRIPSLGPDSNSDLSHFGSPDLWQRDPAGTSSLTYLLNGGLTAKSSDGTYLPHEDTPVTIDVEPIVAADYLFVVLPRDTSNNLDWSNSAFSRYKPLRFSRESDCPPNANKASNSVCAKDFSHPRADYVATPKITDLVNDPGYPICVLQDGGLLP